ncbi:calcium uniporter protein 4, mitochondrial [Vigna umbellata]|uniref:calcium uniporter protein 4, mitochondrial n=1 Tax=Vigna umbellata TaxID=87088 RepID=UPI001F5EC562|nr:calcium uniporter protein 4, mitochondrial [Vigna umbellata]
MAFQKLFAKRLDRFKMTMSYQRAIVSKAVTSPPIVPHESSDDKGFLRRVSLLRRAVYHSTPVRLPEFFSFPVGEKLREALKGINNSTGIAPVAAPVASHAVCESGMSVEDAKKILRAAQMEKVKAKLRNVTQSSVQYSEFLRICVEACENHEQGAEFAKILDDSGNVIVLGNAVFLRPEQVAKSIESLIKQSIANPTDPRRKELEEMEKQKAVIDDKAKAQVRTELYCGLGFLTVQTLGFMRLTFWELDWDVMEPICFFVTSFGFALAYLFFMKTSTEPSFQGFFFHRFRVKQQRLMKKENFDMNRYKELCKVCYPSFEGGVKSEHSSLSHYPPETHLSDLKALRG